MPKKNGLEVLDQLKADPEKKLIPVIMLTNLAGQQDAEGALLKGAVKYIIKSEHEPKEIVDMVKEVLAGYTRNAVPNAAEQSPAPVITSADSSSASVSSTTTPIEPVK